MPWSNPTTYLFNEVSIKMFAPAASGVYALYNPRQWIYIGETNDIQARLLEHLRGDNFCIISMRPPSFSFELCPAALRVGRQNELILELGPACNQRLG